MARRLTKAQKRVYRRRYLQRPEVKERARKTTREKRLKEAYGISSAEFLELLESQGGACAICGEIGEYGQHKLHVDHDHLSGRVRGLLCFRCNSAIGFLRDDSAIVRRALIYLRINETRE